MKNLIRMMLLVVGMMLIGGNCAMAGGSIKTPPSPNEQTGVGAFFLLKEELTKGDGSHIFVITGKGNVQVSINGDEFQNFAKKDEPTMSNYSWSDGTISVISKANGVIKDLPLLHGKRQAFSSIVAGWTLMSIPFNAIDAFEEVSAVATSIWAWDNGVWSVSLPGDADGGAAYAASKGFGLLTEITPGIGFWVNSPGGGIISLVSDY
jgi:hypothetical protein